MKKRKAIIGIMLSVSMVTGLTAGCGGESQKPASGAEGSGEKGRYVEEKAEFVNNGDMSNSSVMAINQLEDGKVRAIIHYYGENETYQVMDSDDDGKTWKESDVKLDFIPDSYEEGASSYIENATIAPDGSIFCLYTESVYSENSSDEQTVPYLIDAQGKASQLKIDIPDYQWSRHYEWDSRTADDEVEETEEDDGVVVSNGDGSDDVHSGDDEGSRIQSVKMVDEDHLYAATELGVLYLLNLKDNNIEKTLQDMDWIDSVNLIGDTLLVSSWDKVVAYDAQTGDKKCDYEALAQIKQNERSTVNVLDVSNNSDIYYVCQGGIYKFLPDTGDTERIVDGNLTSLYNPEGYYSNALALADGAFLVDYQNYSEGESEHELLRYAFDAEAQKVPDQKLTIYTLTDSYSLTRAASAFRKAHPDIYVDVVVGMSGSDGATTSDVIRTLNTQIMAGEGPDVLFMDGLSIADYTDKGLLEDLTSVLSSEELNGKLFEKVCNSYKQDDGKISAVPLSFAVPIILGKKAQLDKINSLQDFATVTAEKVTNSNGNNIPFMASYYALSSMISLMPVNADSWIKEDGTLNSDALREYLNVCKTMYDNMYQSFDEGERQQLDEMKQYMTTEMEDVESVLMYFFAGSDPGYSAMDILFNQAQVSIGSLTGLDSLQQISSVQRQDKDIIYKLLPGASPNTFVPSNVISVNSSSKNKETALDFVKEMLQENAQKVISDRGFPVNKDAFEKSTIDPDSDKEWYDPEESHGGMGTTDENGNEMYLDIYWPKQEDFAKLKEMIDTVDRPMMSDQRILGVIIKDTLDAVISDKSVDDAVTQVEKDIKIYLSE